MSSEAVTVLVRGSLVGNYPQWWYKVTSNISGQWKMHQDLDEPTPVVQYTENPAVQTQGTRLGQQGRTRALSRFILSYG